MNTEYESYNDLIAKKRCYELTKYYDLTEIELKELCDFLKNNSDGKIEGLHNTINLIKDNNIIKSISKELNDISISSIQIDNSTVIINQVFIPKTRAEGGKSFWSGKIRSGSVMNSGVDNDWNSGGNSSGGSFGGGSSNNNNNNNNNR